MSDRTLALISVAGIAFLAGLMVQTIIDDNSLPPASQPVIKEVKVAANLVPLCRWPKTSVFTELEYVQLGILKEQNEVIKKLWERYIGQYGALVEYNEAALAKNRDALKKSGMSTDDIDAILGVAP